jgi:hypothetical protein
MRRRWIVLVFWILLISLLVGVRLEPADGRDPDGRHANSPLKPWFDQLRSRYGVCCSIADGYVVESADWESEKGVCRGHPTPKTWCCVDVPDDSVIKRA